jgi:hypothetical protein
MANLRSQIRQRQSVSPMEEAPRRERRRWPLLAAIAIVGLLALAWAEGGERALRPIAEPVQLPEQP